MDRSPFSKALHLNEVIGQRMSTAVRLRALDLSNRLLFQLPQQLIHLTNLELLRLRGNALVQLPESFFVLTRLTYLSLADNQIHTLTHHISSLALLVHLDLFSNRLSEIPESLANLRLLTHLDVRFNRIERLPNSLGDMTRLEELHVQMNPLKYPPLNVFRRGLGSVLQFLRAAKFGTKIWAHGRVLLLGEQNVGKSTLCRSLLAQGRKFTSTCDLHSVPTIGLNMEAGSFNVDVDGSPVHLTIWDFGGQHEFQITHPFFLSAGALVILVWDLTIPYRESRLMDWLGIVYAITPKSRVIVVGTKVDAPTSADTIERDMRLKDLTRSMEIYKKKISFEEFIAVSNKTGENIDHLKEAIGNAIIKCENISFPIPDGYWDIISFVNAIGKTRDIPVCTLKEFATFTSSISDSIDAETVLQFLHDAGIVIWHKQAHLRDTIVCNAKFLVEVFLQIFNFLRSSFDIGSYSKTELLKRYEASFPNHSVFIQELFRQYQLSFPSGRRQEIFPSLLPYGSPPTDLWADKPTHDCLSFCTYVYKYDVLPKGLFGQILARLNSDVQSQQYGAKLSKSFYSGSHCVFVLRDITCPIGEETPSYAVQIQYLPFEDNIVVEIRSFSYDCPAWSGLQQIQNGIRHIHETFDGLDVEEYLVCPFCSLQMIDPLKGAIQLPFDDDHPEAVATCDYGHSFLWSYWKSFPTELLWTLSSNQQGVSQSTASQESDHISNLDSQATQATDSSMAPSTESTTAPLQLPLERSIRQPSVPNFFWVDVDIETTPSELVELKSTSKSGKSPWALTLLCDRPNAPHFIQMTPFLIENPVQFIATHGRLLITNLNFLLKIYRFLYFPGSMFDVEPSRIHQHLEAQIRYVKEMEDVAHDHVDLSQTVRRWDEYLLEMNSTCSWKEWLEPVSLLNGQKRWLCKLCSTRFSQLYNIEFPLDNIPIKQGYLQKLGGIGGKKWQTRFLILDINQGTLTYYIDSSLANLRGTINLKGAEVVEREPPKELYGFALTVPRRTYFFQSSHKEERNSWVAAIKRSIEKSSLSHKKASVIYTSSRSLNSPWANLDQPASSSD